MSFQLESASVCVCVCKLWNNIATTYQPVGICCLGNYKKGCYMGKCAQLLLTSSSNWGRAANHTPSFEMVGRTNDENIIAFILSLDWWLILVPWLLWICDHQCLWWYDRHCLSQKWCLLHQSTSTGFDERLVLQGLSGHRRSLSKRACLQGINSPISYTTLLSCTSGWTQSCAKYCPLEIQYIGEKTQHLVFLSHESKLQCC